MSYVPALACGPERDTIFSRNISNLSKWVWTVLRPCCNELWSRVQTMMTVWNACRSSTGSEKKMSREHSGGHLWEEVSMYACVVCPSLKEKQKLRWARVNMSDILACADAAADTFHIFTCIRINCVPVQVFASATWYICVCLLFMWLFSNTQNKDYLNIHVSKPLQNIYTKWTLL